VAYSGSVIQWLRDNLQVHRSVCDGTTVFSSLLMIMRTACLLCGNNCIPAAVC
jgi:hypothetical protein